MKQFAAALVVGAAGIAVIQWWQIAYRLHLFFGEYHGERGVNHIGGDTFTLIYITNVAVLAGIIAALRVFWRSSHRWRFASVLVGMINALGWMTFFTMHRVGALVTYDEFIRRWQGGGL